jgi:hypothetical protein
VDALEQCTPAQDRVIDLVAGLDAAAADKLVPADSFPTLGPPPDDDLTETF